jgi:hypothetical protein
MKHPTISRKALITGGSAPGVRERAPLVSGNALSIR